MHASSFCSAARARARQRFASTDAHFTLIRERIQTSLDQVIRNHVPSKSVSSPSVLRSRKGFLAFLGWLAYVTYSPPPTAASPTTSTKQGPISLSSTLIPLSGSRSFNTASSSPSASTRRIHTGPPRKYTTPARSTASARTLSNASLSSTSIFKAGIGSFAQQQPNGWWERLGLPSFSFLNSAAHSQANKNDHHVHSGSSRLRGSGKIHQHLRSPNLYEPVLVPRHPIVLCHGLYGFDVRGPFLGLEIHYWATVLDILRQKVGAEVLIHGVPATGSIQERADALHRFLCSDEAGVRGKKLNFVAHSMGGLDVRHLLANIRPKPEEYVPISLTTISTPHRGSPFMDWCNANIGIGNEYIEKALEEARRNRASNNADARPSPTVRPPYSLKTPIFTRPKSQKSSKDGTGQRQVSSSGSASQFSQSSSDQSQMSAYSLLHAAETAAESLQSSLSGEAVRRSTQQKDADIAAEVKEATKKSSGSSLPFGLSSFLSSLNSLTGSFSSYMLSLLDTPAYAMLSTKYMAEVFNPQTPNVDSVKYYSVAARTPSLAIWHPLWLPKLILDAAAESRTVGGESDGSADALGGEGQGNDGLVSVQSAKWGEFLGVMEGCDHWDLRGGGAPRWRGKVNPATGRPWPVKLAEDSSAKESKVEKKDQEGSSKGSSWIDINRLLFSRGQKKSAPSNNGAHSKPADTNVTAATPSTESVSGSSSSSKRDDTVDHGKDAAQKFLSSFAELTTADGWAGVRIQDLDRDDGHDPAQTAAENASPGSSFTPQHTDDSMIADLVGWIADRLPERDAERRAQAEERDRLISETGLTLYRPESSGLTPPAGSNSDWLGSDVAGIASGSVLQSAPERRPTENAAFSTAHKPPTSQEEKEELNKTKTKTNTSEAKAKKPKEVNDLERFWVALCRHLYVEGH